MATQIEVVDFAEQLDPAKHLQQGIGIWLCSQGGAFQDLSHQCEGCLGQQWSLQARGFTGPPGPAWLWVSLLVGCNDVCWW